LNGKDFEYNQQRYLLLSLEINGLANANKTNVSEESKYQLILFKLSTSRVLFSFEIPFKINQLDVLVKNKHYIENKKNPTLLRNFNVTAVCGCVGGAIQLFGNCLFLSFTFILFEFSNLNIRRHHTARPICQVLVE